MARESPIASELKDVFCEDAELTFFDVGACEGLDSIRYARLFPKAKVFAFEPLESNVNLIRENLRIFGCDRVVVVPQALSDRVGKNRFYVSSGHPESIPESEHWCCGNKSSSLLEPDRATIQKAWDWLQFQRDIEVSTTTIEAFMEDEDIARVDFIHIDVQGAEMLVFLGAGGLLRRTRVIWTEVSEKEYYHGQVIAGEVEAFLAEFGFVKRKVESDPYQSNVLFVNTDVKP